MCILRLEFNLNISITRLHFTQVSSQVLFQFLLKFCVINGFYADPCLWSSCCGSIMQTKLQLRIFLNLSYRLGFVRTDLVLVVYLVCVSTNYGLQACWSHSLFSQPLLFPFEFGFVCFVLWIDLYNVMDLCYSPSLVCILCSDSNLEICFLCLDSRFLLGRCVFLVYVWFPSLEFYHCRNFNRYSRDDESPLFNFVYFHNLSMCPVV